MVPLLDWPSLKDCKDSRCPWYTCSGIQGPLPEAVLKPEVHVDVRDPTATESHVDVSGSSYHQRSYRCSWLGPCLRPSWLSITVLLPGAVLIWVAFAAPWSHSDVHVYATAQDCDGVHSLCGRSAVLASVVYTVTGHGAEVLGTRSYFCHGIDDYRLTVERGTRRRLGQSLFQPHPPKVTA